MLFVKYLLLSAGIGMFVIAAGILAYDYSLFLAHRRRLAIRRAQLRCPNQRSGGALPSR